MAWRCGSRSNAGLVANLVRAELLTVPSVISAFEATDRAHYLRPPHDSYADAPAPIGHNATISAPHMHALLACALAPYVSLQDARVLDVGSGSGYLCAVLRRAGAKQVVGVEHIAELVQRAEASLRDDGLGADLDEGNVQLHVGDGRQGYPSLAPYAAIHVGAAAPSDVPPALLQQLASPGRLVCPVQGADGQQEIIQIDKDEHGKVTRSSLMGVRYVPLCDMEEQVRLR
ncbi:protein-L-isoaspartate O-methyltransferase [Tilletiopsis washingtonensis]|uniref:protein-L-isoaspartate(D-aspartate) O-methyltransferase n=1 Tax=Tilletiopsis washingtonensis TaxID=58919 RepID=A0A316ZES0_9BASI|nr:protein-L-isoaspartate O-methyltransferase [Tilletiopsis washingtonensis]PWN98815.1 protein-L-isoaspartate O-methyltransferase [Tilletiopsis washingtonensis]